MRLPYYVDRLARLLTATFAPAHLVIGLLLLVGAASHPSPVHGFAWGALAAALVGILPYAWVLYAVRAGLLTSRHIPDRNQRLRPLGIGRPPPSPDSPVSTSSELRANSSPSWLPC